MNNKKRIGLFELYSKDPIKADKELWDREINPKTRRGFLKKSGLLAMASVIGANIPFANNMPSGLIPVAVADDSSFKIEGKHEGMIILNDYPVNTEFPAHLLDDEVTPNDKMFIRNNGIPPVDIDVDNWILEVGGESCETTKKYKISDLKEKFEEVTIQLQLECAGNGRVEFNPSASGNQWSLGAISCAKWSGVKLKDVLNDCGIKDDAVYVAYYGADKSLNSDGKEAISRGVPLKKALEDESIIAWGVNGGDIPFHNGHPLRVITAGWPASTSGKWLNKIVIRNQVHDGVKMGGSSYRTPRNPVEPGQESENMCIIESMPVKSLITYPKSGAVVKLNDRLKLRGHAWAGDLRVNEMEISIDFGATWSKAILQEPINRLAWQHWSTEVNFLKVGYYEIWARATDLNGIKQPMVMPQWNPKGYLNNACHRIAVMIES